MAKRPPYSRWRRLPPVFRSGEHKLPGPENEPQRIILYLPGSILDQAESLAEKHGIPTVQEYCSGLLAKAIETERVSHHVAEVEAKRGPLEGFQEIAGDAAYLAEWHERSERTSTGSHETVDLENDPDQKVEVIIPIGDLPLAPEGPEPNPAASESPEITVRVDSESVLGPRVEIGWAAPVNDRGTIERTQSEMWDGNAIDVVLSHAGQREGAPQGFLPSLRRGEPVPAVKVAELMLALNRLEQENQGRETLDRRLSHALHRLALESQVLLTDAWPGVFDEPMVAAIRAVQEMVERILSGQDIRYYPTQSPPAAERLP